MLSYLWKDEHHYDKHVAFYKLFLREGDAFVDVGANVGLISLVAAQIVGPKGVVVSIEGFPKTYHYLKRLIELNGFLNVKVFNLIIGSENKHASFVRNVDDSQNYVCTDENGGIPVCRLDEVTRFLYHIDLLKIDVEGYEKFVLLGATNILNRVSTIYFEVERALYSRYGYSLNEIIDILEEYDFKVFRFTNYNTVCTVRKGYLGDHENLIATRDWQDLLNRTNLRISNC